MSKIGMSWPLGGPLYLSASVENCGLQGAICKSLGTIYKACRTIYRRVETICKIVR